MSSGAMKATLTSVALPGLSFPRTPDGGTSTRCQRHLVARFPELRQRGVMESLDDGLRP